MGLLDCTQISITAGFLSSHSLKHERQLHKQCYDPIGRDVLTHNLGGVRTRKNSAALMIDNMDITDRWHAKSRRGGGSIEAPKPIQTSIPLPKFCTVCTLTIVVKGISLHNASASVIGLSHQAR
ncbi:MAG: hypothetical protein HP477_17265 [Nitrospira sp.]|nr:hypothetical protein [Nitrospira sp.]